MTIDIYNKLEMPRTNVSLTEKQGEFIYSFLKDKDIKNTLEVGFAYGCSASYIISATRAPHIVIDPYQKNFSYRGIKNIKKLKLFKYLIHESDLSHNVLPRLLKQKTKIDFAFIDGDHRYDPVFIDFYYIDLMLNVGGHVLFDDAWMRPVQLVASFIRTNKNYRLIKTPIKDFIMFQKIGRD